MGFHTKIVGVTHDNPDGTNRQIIIGELTQSSPVSLVRDFGNFYDPNAIMVVDQQRRPIGFLKKELALSLALRMDNGETIRCAISALTGGGVYTRGVNIYIDA